MKSVGEWEFLSNFKDLLFTEKDLVSQTHKISFWNRWHVLQMKKMNKCLKHLVKLYQVLYRKLRNSFETGKNFEGNYDGWHVKATFGRFWKNYILQINFNL